ncbi:MAG TPA: DUF488 domain-containing protein [Pseudomonas xinjiangensis]|uniref:DUF488 domain-containing protein n=2 Tax=root TaxID=1 RepID=A0A7V1BRP2_9GAMM|nr:DUF488 domain-containing protein [Halopseudomonas xinjiangensis]HEC46070.1 DUF488 domain-containing protein [Halopseudomonas xinjiangensis]
MAKVDTIWTIGHSTRSIEEFVALLKHYQLQAVADVRRFPGSRRLPHFGEEALRQSLAEAGIAYLWIAELGGRRRASATSINTAWRNASFRGYADHLDDAEFDTGLQHLLALASERRTTMMCAEVLWWRCHRSLVADVLMVRGINVQHIQDENHVTEHPFTAPARLVNGHLSYEPGKGEPLNEKERSKGEQTHFDF